MSDFLDVLLPRICPGCDEPLIQAELCADCTAQLPTTLWPLPMPLEGIVEAWAWAPYDGPVGAALRRGKYRRDERAIRVVSRIMSRSLTPLEPAAAVVVPVPQAPWTSLSRGFSPVSVFAEALADAFDAPLVNGIRRLGWRRQAALSASKRGHLRACFEAIRPLDGEVLLVDDVVTTGATAEACASALLQAGARRIRLMSLTSPRI